jgi:hypothetical protein
MAVSCLSGDPWSRAILMNAEEARLVAPLMSAISPVRSLLAAGPPGDLQHDRAALARRRALPLSGCLPGWRAGCPSTPELTQHVRQRLHRVSPPFRSTAPIGRPTISDNHRRVRRRSRGSNLVPRPVGCGSLGLGRGAIAAGWWPWHPSLISRDASRVQWHSFVDRRSTSVKDPVSCALMSGLLRGDRRWPSWVYAYVSGTNLFGGLEAHQRKRYCLNC